MKFKSVLYVEDDIMVCTVMKIILEREFSTVYTAANGKEGYRLFKAHSPDIVITDLAMPEMNGFEFVKLIQQEKPDTFIVVTTAYREEADTLENVQKLYKPIDRDEFFSCLNNL
jgi:YesN/AraC family two-component response regulator